MKTKLYSYLIENKLLLVLIGIVPVCAILISNYLLRRSHSLNSDLAQVSYAMGQQYGENIRQEMLDIDWDFVAMGLWDVHEDHPSRLTGEELTQTEIKMRDASGANQRKTANANLAESEKFLAENKTKSGVITTDSGLQYEILKEGDGRTPKASDMVHINFRGTLTNGTEVESTLGRGAPVHVMVSGVYKGWTEILQLMKEGEKVRVYLPPKLGYGDAIRGNIPANSVLIYELELVDVMGK